MPPSGAVKTRSLGKYIFQVLLLRKIEEEIRKKKHPLIRPIYQYTVTKE